MATPSDLCLDPDAVARYVAALRSGHPMREIDDHLDGCAECRRLVFAVACTSFGGHASDRSDGPAQTLGRYRLDELLATGGMGMVFAAYDPALGRRVAIKVLRRSPTEDHSLQLMREAQALAKLSHHNVVAVFDVGEDAGEVYLAMELLDGRDLTAWRRETARSWREVVAVFVAIGGGLAAAHAAGIVHRDLKPGNVIVTAAGRVCLTDFGLATHTSDPTQDGLAVAGTPAYMAPEQIANGAADARSDVYGYCLSLFETLHDRLPGGDGGDANPVARIPAELAAIVERGLAVDPSERPVSIEAVVHGLRRIGRRRNIAIGVGVAVGAAAAFAAIVATTHGDGPTCATGDDELAAVWNAGRAEQMRAALAATGVAYAASSAQRVGELLDGYASRWIAAHGAICRATHVDGTQSSVLLDRRMACLDDRKRQLAIVADALVAIDRTTAPRAIAIAGGLPSLAACSALDLERAALPDDPAVVVRIQSARDQIARARVLERAGRLADARELAQSTLAQAQPLGYQPLVVEAALLAGRIQDQLHDLPEARRSLELAGLAATRANDPRLQAESLAELALALAKQTSDRSAAVGIARQARAVLERAGSDPKLEYTVHLALAITLNGIDPAEVTRELDLARKALDQISELDGARMNRAEYVEARAMVVGGSSDRIAALRESADAVAAAYGADHPTYGVKLMLLAQAHITAGETEEAKRVLARATPLVESIPASRAIVRQIRVLVTKDPLERLAMLEATVAESESTMQPLELAGHLMLLAATATEADLAARGAPAARRSLAIIERAYGTSSERLIPYLLTVADSELALGEAAQAAQVAQRTIAIAQAAPDSRMSALALPKMESILAVAYFALRRCAEVLPLLDHPGVRAEFGDTPAGRAEPTFLASACEWELSEHRDAALRRARAAVAASDASPGDLRIMKAWLAERRN